VKALLERGDVSADELEDINTRATQAEASLVEALQAKVSTDG
jgi:hypothetical protein